jgi:hypothetical protein
MQTPWLQTRQKHPFRTAKRSNPIFALYGLLIYGKMFQREFDFFPESDPRRHQPRVRGSPRAYVPAAISWRVAYLEKHGQSGSSAGHQTV